MGRWSDLARKFEVGRSSLTDNRQKPAKRIEDNVSTAITSFAHNRHKLAESPTEDLVADILPVSAGCRERKSIGDRPITWTGKVVSLEEWRRLSEWERQGPNGRVWNGLARQWKP